MVYSYGCGLFPMGVVYSLWVWFIPMDMGTLVIIIIDEVGILKNSEVCPLWIATPTYWQWWLGKRRGRGREGDRLGWSLK